MSTYRLQESYRRRDLMHVSASFGECRARLAIELPFTSTANDEGKRVVPDA
jgi:Fe2+ transport system protein B